MYCVVFFVCLYVNYYYYRIGYILYIYIGVYLLNKSDQALEFVSSYFLALRGVMLNGGPGGPRDLGNKSTHIIRRP